MLTGSLLFTEFARFLDNDNSGSIYALRYRGLFNITGESDGLECVIPCMVLTSLVIITTLFLFATIFVYKKRMIQLRLCKINLILLACLTGQILYRCFDAKATLEKGEQFFNAITNEAINVQLSFSWVLIFPIISVILVLLAMRGIRKDEALIKSLNRIR